MLEEPPPDDEYEEKMRAIKYLEEKRKKDKEMKDKEKLDVIRL